MTVHLVVPGLFGAFPRSEQARRVQRLPALERLFARADQLQGPSSYPQVLFQLYGMPAEAPLATAPLCYHSDSAGQSESRYLLHADPLHLRPDQDRLLAFDFQQQPLRTGEADSFVDAFNRHFQADGLELLAPHPVRWYLALEVEPDADFHPLAAVIGRNIDSFLPYGSGARHWRGWMNEIQMLFHSLPANMQREASGLLPVNGLWFSGGGKLPNEVPGGFAGISGDCCLLKGLDALAADAGSDQLIVEHTAGRAVLDADRTAWEQALAELDVRLQNLMDQDLQLYSCDGLAWRWRPGMRRRWWRRTRPIEVGWRDQ